MAEKDTLHVYRYLIFSVMDSWTICMSK